MGQDQSADAYIASIYPCSNCEKIASIVRDWPAFTARGKKRSHRIGRWRDVLDARGAYYSISASNNGENLSIHLYEKGVDPEELSTRTYELRLLPSKAVNPHGLHYIKANSQWVNVEQIRYWVEECDSTHGSACKESRLQTTEQSGDVIFIDVEKNCLVKSHLSQRYVALSYVWGIQREIFRTVLSNVNELMQVNSLSDAWEKVPATIQDAIILTRKLGIRFLWIDRLCIVQDDETAIKNNIAQMASIYAQSYFTLIATDGDSDAGILGVPGGSKPRHFPLEQLVFEDVFFLVIHKDVYFGQESALTQDYDYPGSYEPEGERRWHTRAWTFQERTVSRRCLVFNNDTITWECGKGLWSELSSTPQMSFDDPTYRNRKFGDPHWRLERELWPNATQYATLCEGFSKRKLTYANDALNAFSAITQTLTSSFPGGFFFALPEFMLDMALLWTLAKPHNVRREMFPSWSWVAWEGTGYGYEGINLEHVIRDCWGPNFTNDDLRIFRRPLNTWTKKNAVTGKMEEIGNTYHVWLNAKEDEIRGLPGWKSSQKPEKFTLKELGFHKSSVSHAFPIANSRPVQSSPSPTWEPFLYARVQTAKFRFAGQPDPSWGTVGLMDSTGKSVGNLTAHDRGGDHEPLGKKGRECCLMAVCEASVPEWSYFIGEIHFITRSNYSANNLAYPPAKPGKPFKWVDVMWVEWKDKEGQIASRRGVGRIWLDAWERASPKEIDITLG